ncbi:unnamed protein product (macronuclear) [Paramecium tetraurelia]|uniref:B box-type domain-containing protein n=1 Tax=Paramecium tetraurelia TaxID=5888 RepID=A0CXZ0_PARTE|nr:uncharacterized protein GSPATT00011289001 [Paramecium tetraurelia]CAK75657.1 unnamed protein product [Paramecium tetraurelia]|eukprot:XP_001443054.1 hypothetical protein (macronuclear) [Paramecium tetraurelia strain d4-2]
MSEDIKSRVMNYFNCPLGDIHEGEQLNFVCLEANCKEMGLICPVCRTQKHSKHKVIPLKIFLADIYTNINAKQNQNSLDSLLVQLDQSRLKMLSSLKDIVQKMVLQIKLLEEQINLSYKNTKQRLQEQNQTQMNFPLLFQQILNTQYKNVELLKQDVRKIIDNVSQLQPGKIEIDFKPQKLFDSYQKAVNILQLSFQSQEAVNQLQMLFTSFKQSTQKIVKPIEKFTLPVVSHNQINFIFSQTLKSATINVQDLKIATQQVQQNTENRFILIEPSIQDSSKIAFKIVNLTNFIGLGIGLKNVLQTKNMRFDQQSIGHGSYMASSNDLVFSHHKQEENMISKSFPFATGDIVILDVNFENQIIKFKNKNSQNEPISLTFDIPENDEIVFCVNMGSVGEKVEILDDWD